MGVCVLYTEGDVFIRIAEEIVLEMSSRERKDEFIHIYINIDKKTRDESTRL